MIKPSLLNKSETQTVLFRDQIMVHTLRQDEPFFNKIISRKSTEGCSSRILYYRTAQGIPFKWEEHPGTPKNPPSKLEEIPPLSPPPALLSSAFPKPSVERHGKSPPWPTRLCKLWFNRKGKRSSESKRVQSADSDKNTNFSYKSESFELCSSEFESMASPSHSRSSSSSSSLSSSNRPSRQSLTVHQRFLGCSLWNSRRV